MIACAYLEGGCLRCESLQRAGDEGEELFPAEAGVVQYVFLVVGACVPTIWAFVALPPLCRFTAFFPAEGRAAAVRAVAGRVC